MLLKSLLVLEGVPNPIMSNPDNLINMKSLSNSELLYRLEAINKSNAIIEFDLEGTVLEVNGIFLETLGYKTNDASKIVGRHHSIFVKPAYADSEEYENFWKRLRKGEFFSGEIERVKRDGSTIYLQATYNPILDESGKVYKVMKIASDITETIEAGKKIEKLTEELKLELEKSEALKNSIELEKNKALDDLDVLIKKSQSELVGIVVKVALMVIIGVGVITSIMYCLAIYTSKDTQIIGSTWSNMFGILLTNAFSIVGTIMGVKYATESK
jgi:methyl-accepting chemotaxis protein